MSSGGSEEKTQPIAPDPKAQTEIEIAVSPCDDEDIVEVMLKVRAAISARCEGVLCAHEFDRPIAFGMLR